jgi:hypothetical protein
MNWQCASSRADAPVLWLYNTEEDQMVPGVRASEVQGSLSTVVPPVAIIGNIL